MIQSLTLFVVIILIAHGKSRGKCAKRQFKLLEGEPLNSLGGSCLQFSTKTHLTTSLLQTCEKCSLYP